jgi:hypothetical protein
MFRRSERGERASEWLRAVGTIGLLATCSTRRWNDLGVWEYLDDSPVSVMKDQSATMPQVGHWVACVEDHRAAAFTNEAVDKGNIDERCLKVAHELITRQVTKPVVIDNVGSEHLQCYATPRSSVGR